MTAPDKFVSTIASAKECQPQQRWLRQLKTSLLIVTNEVFQHAVALLSIELPPIVFFDIDIHIPVNNLEWLFQSIPHETCPQYRMASYNALPRFLKCRAIKITFDREYRLFEVDARLRRVERMEQHALLHGRELIQIFQIRLCTLFSHLQKFC